MKKKTYFIIMLVFFAFCFSLPVSSRVKNEGKIRLLFVGDILLARHPGFIMRNTENLHYPFEKIGNFLKGADLTFGNMEGAFTGSRVTGTIRSKNGTWYCFCSPPAFVEALKYVGFDMVNLANNHSANCGRAGILDTTKTLNKAGIRFVGAGRNINEAESCQIMQTGGLKIGFLGRTSIGTESKASDKKPGLAVLDERILKSVKSCRSKADVLIVTLHWGVEGADKPDDLQRRYAHWIISKGADMVIGHHPHVLQEVEIYKGKVIAYSLGNFVFDNPKKSWRTSMILEVIIDKKTKKQTIRKIPVYITNFQPTLAD